MSVLLQIRVDDRLDAALKRYAPSLGLTVSDMVKKLAIDKMGFDYVYGTVEKIEHKPVEIQTREEEK